MPHPSLLIALAGLALGGLTTGLRQRAVWAACFARLGALT